QRTLALPIGRSAINFKTKTIKNREMIKKEPLDYSLVYPTSKIPFQLQEANFAADYFQWPKFHNGVATAFQMIAENKDIESSWIIAHKLKDELNAHHAGFLFGLGLLGYLNLSTVDIYQYMASNVEIVNIGLLIGLSFSKRKTMDNKITKLCSIHIPSFTTIENQTNLASNFVAMSAIVGIGFLFQESGQRRMVEMLLYEIKRNINYDKMMFSTSSTAEINNDVFRGYAECYALSAGFSLGLTLLGLGRNVVGLDDLNIIEELDKCINGGKVSFAKNQNGTLCYKGNGFIHTDITSPAAMMALSFMFMKTNDALVSQILSIPTTAYDLTIIRPDFLLLRVCHHYLVLWDSIKLCPKWLKSQIPNILGKIEEEEELTLENPLTCPFVAILTGLIFISSIKYAGYLNNEWKMFCLETIDKLTRITSTIAVSLSEKVSKIFIKSCINQILLSASLVMAGSGDLDLIRRCRVLHGRIQQDFTYGNHMCVHLALGFLCLSNGTKTLSVSSRESIAHLFISCYPVYPKYPNDNQYHFQILRHLWATVTQDRCLVTKSSGKVVAVEAKINLKNNSSFYKITPFLLPPLDSIRSIELSSPMY
ncbi:hypothetical protein ROZALSC1DRAFT_238, partial [Rozella allomycis CSF55]